jgi:hypothetical protein
VFCEQEDGHSVWCELGLPWLPSPPSWVLGGACDPNGVLQFPDLGMDLQLLDGTSDVLQGVAGLTEPDTREPAVSPQMDTELVNWLTESSAETTCAINMIGAAESPLPDAWEHFRGGLDLLSRQEEAPDTVRADASVQRDGDDLVGEVAWSLDRCDVMSPGVDRPGRAWPTSTEIADTLLGLTEERGGGGHRHLHGVSSFVMRRW